RLAVRLFGCADVRRGNLPHVRDRVVRPDPAGRDLREEHSPGESDPSHDLLDPGRIRVGSDESLQRTAVVAPLARAGADVQGRGRLRSVRAGTALPLNS